MPISRVVAAVGVWAMGAQRKWMISAASVAALVVAVGTAPAHAQAAASPEQAWQALNADAAANAGDADYTYRLGLAALDAGHVAEAIVALQRVLALQPDHAQARAEIARAYAMAGDIDTARAQFDTVLGDPSLPDPVRRRFTGIVEGLDRQISGKQSNVSGFLDVSGGHDSNVNSATALTSVTIPLFAVFGPGALSGNARRISDGYAEAQGGVSLVTGLGRADRLFVSALGDYRGNFHASVFNQATLTGTLGIAHTMANRDTLSVSGQVQQFWLDSASYRQAYNLIGQYTHALSGGRALSFSAQYGRYHYNNQPLYNVHHMALGMSYATRSLVVSADGGYEAAGHGSTQSNLFADASLSGEVPLGKKLALFGGAALGVRFYDRADALFLKKRQDARLDLSAGVRFMLTPRLSLRPRATYTRNFSNIALFDTSRWTAGVGARLEF